MRFISATACIVTLLSGCSKEKTTIATPTSAVPTSAAIAEDTPIEVATVPTDLHSAPPAHVFKGELLPETIDSLKFLIYTSPDILSGLRRIVGDATEEECVAYLSNALLAKDATVWRILMETVYSKVEMSAKYAAILPVAIHLSGNATAIAQSAALEMFQIVILGAPVPSKPAFIEAVLSAVDFEDLSVESNINMWINGAKDLTMYAEDQAAPVIAKLVKEQIQTNGAVCGMLMELFPNGKPVDGDNILQCQYTSITADEDVFHMYFGAITDKYEEEYTA